MEKQKVCRYCEAHFCPVGTKGCTRCLNTNRKRKAAKAAKARRLAATHMPSEDRALRCRNQHALLDHNGDSTMNDNPNCDGSGPHAIQQEVRVLPTDGGGNANLCVACWAIEIEWRKHRNREVAHPFDLPEWNTLQIYLGDDEDEDFAGDEDEPEYDLYMPVYWASYLINGDASGLLPGEEEHIEAYLEQNRIIEVFDCADYSHFTWSFDLYGGIDKGGEICGYSVTYAKDDTNTGPFVCAATGCGYFDDPSCTFGDEPKFCAKHSTEANNA